MEPSPDAVPKEKLLKGRIRRGEYPPGMKLSPARELAELYGVSLSTAQRVQLILKERGLIVGRQGDGVYVAEES